MKYIRIIFFVLASIAFTFCERIDRFYRPNMPEKLCSIGVIDADDTTDYHVLTEMFDFRTNPRFISFERSYQLEYPDEVNDSLRDFTFSITSRDQELIHFKSDTALKALLGFKIPADIDFLSGNTYYLHASEKELPEISAEIKVPPLPPVPEIVSVKRERITLPNPTTCIGFTSAMAAVIEFSFENDQNRDYYYAILLTGHGVNESNNWAVTRSQLEFDIRYCNTPGFLAVLHGFSMPQWTCVEDSIRHLTMAEAPVNAYFIDGGKIPDERCKVKLSTQIQDEESPFSILFSLNLKLLSIPKILFEFEKGLFVYQQTAEDPFTEPIYLNGNIVGGNGVFAICRSRELFIKFNPWLVGQ